MITYVIKRDGLAVPFYNMHLLPRITFTVKHFP